MKTNILNLNKVVNVISEEFKVKADDIVVKPYGSKIVLFIENKSINYEDVCYSVEGRDIDKKLADKVLNKLNEKIVFLSHSAMDNIGLTVKESYPKNEVLESACKTISTVSRLLTNALEWELTDALTDLIESSDMSNMPDVSEMFAKEKKKYETIISGGEGTLEAEENTANSITLKLQDLIDSMEFEYIVVM